ncbi:MAG: hypothetical protein ABII68_03770 [Pseudomonadota bacterium]
MDINELFNILDHNNHGELSRADLHESARWLGWHWREAPLFALLDLLTLLEPMSENRFVACMTQVAEDPHGPYGKVLLNAPHFLPETSLGKNVRRTSETKGSRGKDQQASAAVFNNRACNDLISFLNDTVGPVVANSFGNLLKNLDIGNIQIPMDDAALLIIDPQRSFTRGAWMKSTGPEAETDVEPIRLAFEKCAQFLCEKYGRIEMMFTRCPFPPDSYEWDDVFANIIDDRQLYFIKPGNSVWFPSTNGFREWVERFVRGGRRTLVMAGCTLNSCLRVSSIETQKHFINRKLRVVVDLSMSGARARSFKPSSLYGGVSAVESAIREMTDSGVRVARRVNWI